MALEMSSTTKAKIAAAALTALSVMSGSFSANAQQMAAAPSTPDFSACDRMHQANPKGAIQCRVDALKAHTGALRQESGALRQESGALRQESGALRQESGALRQESAALRQRTQVAQIDGDCAREISELRAANPAATEIARELVRVSGRPAAEYGICRLRDAIRAGLDAR